MLATSFNENRTVVSTSTAQFQVLWFAQMLTDEHASGDDGVVGAAFDQLVLVDGVEDVLSRVLFGRHRVS